MAKKYFSGVIKGFFRFLNNLRLFLINLLFWGIILAAVFLVFRGQIVPEVNNNTVLNISLNGYLVEQYSGGYKTELENLSTGNREILLRDLKRAIDYASSDDRITSIFLDLSGLSASGLSKIQEIALSLENFRKSGKEILCFSQSYNNGSYYLASRADRIIMDPLGEVRLRGFSNYINYYKKGLDKFSIKMNVFKAGNYKSAVEPYLAESMSDYNREAISAFYGRIMNYTADETASARKMSRDDLFDYIKNYHLYLRETGGDGAEAALGNNFIDSVADFDSASDLIEEVEEIGWRDYLKASEKDVPESENKIAVITASGIILDGDFEPGKIGSETFRKLLKSASEDPDIKAVVLRIDSRGGSASASEIIRREVVRLREKGKPVVVSMSSAAASGGYWISADSDMIISYPSTMTGSIGVFAVLPDFSDFLEKYPGITVDGYSVLDSPEQYRPDMKLDEREKEIIQLGVENTYRKFINIVAEGRGLEESDVEKIAGGRIWSGLDAVENGLVDKTGYFDDAIDEASKLAELGSYNVIYMDPEEDWRTQAVKELTLILNKIKTSPFDKYFESADFSSLFLYRDIEENVFEPGRIYSWTGPVNIF